MTDLERIKKDVVKMDSRANVCWYDTKVLTKAVRLILEELTADRKTENSSEKPNNCEDEPKIECLEWYDKVGNYHRYPKTEPTGYNLSPVDKDINVRSKDEPQKRCDECIHFDKPYKKRDKDGMLIIGVECDGMDEPCDKWTDEPQTDCPWK